MSEMRDYVALRFRIKENIVEEQILDYFRKKGLISEDITEFYDIELDGYNLVWDYDTDKYYFDKVFVSKESCDDLCICKSVESLIKIADNVLSEFGDLVDTDDYKIICMQWYDGSDMPVSWNESESVQ